MRVVKQGKIRKVIYLIMCVDTHITLTFKRETTVMYSISYFPKHTGFKNRTFPK